MMYIFSNSAKISEPSCIIVVFILAKYDGKIKIICFAFAMGVKIY